MTRFSFFPLLLSAAPLLAQPTVSSMPPYEPTPGLAGQITVGGSDLDGAVEHWEDAFQKLQPNIRLIRAMRSGDGFSGALESGGADLSFSDRDPMVADYLSYFETFHRDLQPTQIDIATGTLTLIWPLTFYVRSDNPLTQLTAEQVDGIFGSERSGAWQGYRWYPQLGRGADKNIRTWGQLGLTGEWTDKPIHTYGYAAPGPKNHFQLAVFHGGDKWNPNFLEYVSAGTKTVGPGEIGLTGTSDYMLKTVMPGDPDGICWAPGALPAGVTGLKALAISPASGQPAVPCTAETVQSWAYPFTRSVHVFVNREPGQPMDPCVKEFLRFILSRDGQTVTQAGGILFPLPARVADEERAKIENWASYPQTPAVSGEAAPAEPAKIRMFYDEDEYPVVPRLAESLGYLQDEGLQIDLVKVEPYSGDDYEIQAPMIDGKVDAAYHWFHHAIFGARLDLPIKAVMVTNDAPAITVMVANRDRDCIRSAADFCGRNVAEGAEYGTKSIIMHALARHADLPADCYTPVFMETEGRQERVIQGLKDGQVDVLAFQEPIASAVLKTGLASVLYDFNRTDTTVKALGAPWPSESLLMAPAFIAAHPDTVQHLVNAFVRTMRFINSKTADEIAARLPGYFDGPDRAAEMQQLRLFLRTFAQGDYAIDPAGARLQLNAIRGFRFDQTSAEGKWRATSRNDSFAAEDLYTNEFVERAMNEFPQ
jgi:phosphate transport system substrate-binding protein